MGTTYDKKVSKLFNNPKHSLFEVTAVVLDWTKKLHMIKEKRRDESM